MRLYEGLFIFPPEATTEAKDRQEKLLEEMIRKFGGEVVQKVDQGKKLMGYAIRKFHEGHFFLFDFRLLPANVTDFKKTLRLNEELLHFMITVKDERLIKKQEAINAAAAANKPALKPSVSPAAS